MYFDGLLTDRGYFSGNAVYLAPDAICDFYGLELTTRSDGSGFQLTAGGVERWERTPKSEVARKLAERMALPKEEIYRGYVRNIGGNCQTVCVKAEAAETLRRIWSGKGLGWVSDTLPSKLPGCENLVLYYGSSEYDTRQMSRLIDMIVQDCKACGIPTATPEEIARMMDRWGT